MDKVFRVLQTKADCLGKSSYFEMFEMSFAISFVKRLFVVLLFLYIGQYGVSQDRIDSLSPFIQLAPGIAVQVGIIGTDPDHDAEPVSVFKLNRQGINTTFGKSKDGVLFDFKVTRPIMDGLAYSLATRNHAWASQGFFTDNKVSVNGNYGVLDFETTKFRVRPEVFYAYSSQRLSVPSVVDSRLGASFTTDLNQNLQDYGSFQLRNVAALTYYPSIGEWQYAIRLIPSWTLTLFENRFVMGYDFQLANAASPFDGHVDRQGYINRINAVWHYEPSSFLSGTLKNSLGVSYDWRKDVEKNQSPLRSAFWVLDTRQVFDTLVWELRLELQAAALLADLFVPVDDSDLRASFSLNTDLYHHDWHYHFKGEYKFVHPDKENDIDIFEFGLGPVVEFEGQNFRPYVALDFAEALFNDSAIDTIKLVAIGFEVLQ